MHYLDKTTSSHRGDNRCSLLSPTEYALRGTCRVSAVRKLRALLDRDRPRSAHGGDTRLALRSAPLVPVQQRPQTQFTPAGWYKGGTPLLRSQNPENGCYRGIFVSLWTHSKMTRPNYKHRACGASRFAVLARCTKRRHLQSFVWRGFRLKAQALSSVRVKQNSTFCIIRGVARAQARVGAS
jgi:hypothetical protein